MCFVHSSFTPPLRPVARLLLLVAALLLAEPLTAALDASRRRVPVGELSDEGVVEDVADAARVVGIMRERKKSSAIGQGNRTERQRETKRVRETDRDRDRDRESTATYCSLFVIAEHCEQDASERRRRRSE